MFIWETLLIILAGLILYNASRYLYRRSGTYQRESKLKTIQRHPEVELRREKEWIGTWSSRGMFAGIIVVAITRLLLGLPVDELTMAGLAVFYLIVPLAGVTLGYLIDKKETAGSGSKS